MGVKTSEHRLISHVGFGSRLQVELEDDMIDEHPHLLV